MIKSYIKTILAYLGKHPSKAVIWLSLAIITIMNLNYENWNHRYKIIAWDVNSYYAYLPVVFIHNDIDMEFLDEDRERYGEHYWPIVTPKKKLAIVTSVGLSYMYAPFFLAGHAYVKITGYQGDEFSPPYKLALIISCLFYFIFGLLFLRKVLLKYFSELVTALSLLIIIFGTNLLHYVTEEPTMSHAYSFSLISIFLYQLIRWFEKSSIKNAVLTGLLAGLITLIRPNNILVVLLLVFWGVATFTDLQARIIFYFRKIHLVFIMILAFLVVWIPQFAYWHYVSGSVFFNTYGSVGAGFFFDQPQILYAFFSFRKGWLIYTPMMIFTLIGFIMIYKSYRKIFWAITIFFVLNVWVITSWWCWWYGGGFGQRAFVDSYPILSLSLAAFLAFVVKQKVYLKVPLLLLIAVLMYVNIFQTRQYKKGIIHHTMMTKSVYWDVFLKMEQSPRFWKEVVFPDYKSAMKGEYYTEMEIPYNLQQKLGMTGYDYVEKLKDSLNNVPGKWDSYNTLDSISRDKLVNEEAMVIFRKMLLNHKQSSSY